MKPSARDVEMAHAWVRTKLTLCGDSGRPYPNHVNEVSQLLAQAREEGRLMGIEEAAKDVETPPIEWPHGEFDRVMTILRSTAKRIRALGKEAT